MEKRGLFVRTLLLTGLAVGFGKDTVEPNYRQPVTPRVAKASGQAVVSIEEFDLPDLVEESTVTLNNQPVLTLNTDQKDPDRIMEELENKESGEVLENVEVEIYHAKQDKSKVWGFTIPITRETTEISVDLIVPDVRPSGGVTSSIGQSEESLVILNEEEVVSLTNELGQIDVVIVQDGEDAFNKFPNGAAFEGGEEVAVQVNMEVSGTLYSATESLPQQ